MHRSVWIGFDPREADAFAVCRHSIKRNSTQQVPINGIVLSAMQQQGLYSRPWERRGAQMWDVISDAPMSTEFACTRFLTPILAEQGWSLFMDCDMLVRGNIIDLFELADPQYAVMCVKHHHVPDKTIKMDAQMQTRYARKNWSSVMLFNCEHEANNALTLDMINTLPGRDLHRFCWLEDHQIGALPAEWNYLVGHTEIDAEPKIVHFTDGIPSMTGYKDVPYQDEWWEHLRQWAA